MVCPRKGAELWARGSGAIDTLDRLHKLHDTNRGGGGGGGGVAVIMQAYIRCGGRKGI